MIKKFKFTIVFAILFAVIFLHINVSVTDVDDIKITAEKIESGYIISGEILPIYKTYKGYEYKTENGAAIIKIKTSFGMFGKKDFEFKIGECKYVYIADEKEQMEITE